MNTRKANFVVSLGSLDLDEAAQARISSKISSVVMSEIAHLDLSDALVVAGRIPGGLINGIYLLKNIKQFSQIEEQLSKPSL